MFVVISRPMVFLVSSFEADATRVEEVPVHFHPQGWYEEDLVVGLLAREPIWTIRGPSFEDPQDPHLGVRHQQPPSDRDGSLIVFRPILGRTYQVSHPLPTPISVSISSRRGRDSPSMWNVRVTRSAHVSGVWVDENDIRVPANAPLFDSVWEESRTVWDEILADG